MIKPALPGREIDCMRLAAAGLFALIACLLAWSVVDEWRFAGERIGVIISGTAESVLIDDVISGSPAERAGLMPGDRIASIEGEPVENFWVLEDLFDEHVKPGQPFSSQVMRNGELTDITLKPGVPINLASLLAKFVLVAAYLGLAFLSARYREQDLRARLLMILVSIIAIELAIPAGHTLGTPALAATVVFFLFTTGIQISLELHLVSLIPERLPLLRRRPWLVPACYAFGVVAGLALAVLGIYEWFFADEDSLFLLDPAQSGLMLAWAVSVVAILARQAWRARTVRQRNQALLVLAGLVPWALYIIVSSLWSGWLALDPRLTELIENLVLLIFPATVFLAIFRYGLFEVESLVRRGLAYGVVALMIVILLYTLLTTALPLFQAHLGTAGSQWLITGLALVCGTLLRPIRAAVERLVERGLLHRRKALRHRLIRVAGSLSVLNELDELIQQLADSTRSAADLKWAAVVAVESTDDKLKSAFSQGIDERGRARIVELLDSHSSAFRHLEGLRRPLTVSRFRRHNPGAADGLAAIGAEVLVPLFYQHRTIGILCLGQKASGELFRREEIELLDLFSHQVAASLENLRLFQDATYEQLTGLFRREAVLQHLEAEAARSLRKGTPLSALMIDLDRFKQVNDAHGHLFGDRILSRAAEAMNERVRAVDALGRYGGEEFLLVLSETDAEGATTLAEELRQAVSDLRFEVPDGTTVIGVTVSIGVATVVPASDESGDPSRFAAEVLGRADAAVYRAKSAGRNKIVVHQP